MNTQENSVNRVIPKMLPLYGEAHPFKGVVDTHSAVRGLPPYDDLIDQLHHLGKHTHFMPNLKDAILSSGLQDGMRISFHHHLRLGDQVMRMVLEVLTEMGYQRLILCLTSVMGESCTAVLAAAHAGVISMIETTGLKAPLSTAVEDGTLQVPVIFRSHGGRARAIMSGDITIDVAFIVASAVDYEGNLTGSFGPNRFGSLGYAMPDARKASCVIGITDYQRSVIPISISASAVDIVVITDSIGTKDGLSGGSIRQTKRPIEQLIARKALSVIISSGIVQPGFSFQAGSGGISLAVSTLLAGYLEDTKIPCSFISGGITGSLVSMLREGRTERLYDVQSFDDEASRSLGENPKHIEMSASLYGNPYHPHCIAHQLDLMVLSATEVDLHFHVNSITGTNGRILGALGGAPDTAAGALVTIVVIPAFRGRIPSVNRDVYIICTPGDSVDIVVTELGIAVNPRRKDLLESLQRAGIVVLSIEQLMNTVYEITGIPDTVRNQQQTGRVQAIVEYRDGTVLDTLWSKR